MQEDVLKKEIEMLKQTLKNTHFMYAASQTKIFNELKNRLGVEVESIVEEVNTKEVCNLYLKSGEHSKDKSIKSFIQLLWEPLRAHGYEFTIDEKDDTFQIKCTACPYARLYNAIGQNKWGYTLYCAADEALVNNFNDNIGFKRTKTLMDGQDCCDHFYYMK
jgi:predicted ArsR family transcriptional regulator